jgi:hypothetical protein
VVVLNALHTSSSRVVPSLGINLIAPPMRSASVARVSREFSWNRAEIVVTNSS